MFISEGATMLAATATVRDLRRLWKPHKLRLGSHPNAIRLHRACSWLERAERLDPEVDSDLILLTQWIAFNCLYGHWDSQRREPCPDRESWQSFSSKLLRLDSGRHLERLLIEHKRLVVAILENEYLASYFWKEPGQQSKQQARNQGRKVHARYVEQAWTLILDQVLDRVYFLRCQLVHGAATCGGKLNRTALKRAVLMLGHLLRGMLQVYIEQGSDQDWGLLCYPPTSSASLMGTDYPLRVAKPR